MKAAGGGGRRKRREWGGDGMGVRTKKGSLTASLRQNSSDNCLL